ncbi:MAG: ABC transporter permease [Rhodobacteraceae bacterium]|nr:ABC transporter permease [Paracoccaceae bacterium]
MIGNRTRTTLEACYLLLMLGFIYLPVVILVLFSFQAGNLPVPPFDGPSLRWYREVFENDRLLDALANSLVVAGASGLAATVLGFLAAYSLSRHRVRFIGAVRFMLIAPVTVSYLIIGMGLLITFNVVGVNKSLWAICLGHTIMNLPLSFAIIFSQMSDSHKDIDAAAHDLGANDLQTILFVAVPMMKAPLFASFFLAATLSWDEFIIAFLLSRFDTTLPVIIFEMLRAGLTPEVNAVGTLVFLISMGLVMAVAAVLVFRKEK